MQEIIKYRCEICGTIYDTQEACAECEGFHVIPSLIDTCVFHPITSKPEFKFPVKINVTMADNSVLEYYFKRILSSGSDVSSAEEPVATEDSDETI